MYQRDVMTKEQFPELAATLLNEGFTTRFIVRGASMRPFIRSGDSVTLRPAACSRLKIGTIVFLKTVENGYMLHRIVRLTPKGYLIAGDALVGHDIDAPSDDIIGVAISCERKERPIRLISVLPLLWYRFRPLRHGWRRATRDRRLRPGNPDETIQPFRVDRGPRQTPAPLPPPRTSVQK